MGSPGSGTKQRRHHRKSRLGCHQCKRRKIKCDENRPTCLNCSRRGLGCGYILSPTAGDGLGGACTCKCPGCHAAAELEGPARGCEQAAPVADRAAAPADLPTTLAEHSSKLGALSRQLTSMETFMAQLVQLVSPQPMLTYTDMDLANHFYTSTLSTLSGGDEQGRQYWTTCLGKFGCQYPHLYHLTLALAALHKARLHSHQRAELLAQAERHHAIGVQGSTALLGAINDDNFEVVRTSASLIGLINLAMGPRPGEYIVFSNQAGPNFLDLLRGLRSIRRRETNNTTQEGSPAGASSPGTTSDASAGSPFANDPDAHLRRLYARAREILEPRRRQSYTQALDDLEQFFILLDSPRGASGGPGLPDAAHRLSPLGWIYRSQDDFLERLQNRESLALVIVAYFAVVLKELEQGWPADGWPEHIMAKICEEIVDPGDRELIQWPMMRLEETALNAG